MLAHVEAYIDFGEEETSDVGSHVFADVLIKANATIRQIDSYI